MRKRRFLSFILLFCLCAGWFLADSAPVHAVGFETGIDTYSQSYLLINLDTGTLVSEKDPDKKMEPASITKVMTYIVAYEQIRDVEGTVITIPQQVEDDLLGTGSSMSGILVGEKLTALQLLNMMMVPSGNDAALTFAYYVGDGDPQKFVNLMNEKAAELGCENTHFMNPHGLHDENHYTTARDLAVITQYAMNLPYFSEITDQVTYTLPATNLSEARTVYTTNRMLDQNADGGEYYYPYTKGIKTGSHDQAGYCLVSTAVQGGYSYLCVALGAPSVDADGNSISKHGEMIDSKALYQWAFENLELKTLVKTGEAKGEVKVDFAWNTDSMLVAAEEGYSAIMPSSVEDSSILYTVDLPESVEAPIKKGEVLGTLTMQYADQTLATVNLVATESVERSELLHTLDIGRDILSSNWFVSIIAIVIFLLLLYVVLALLYNRKKKRMRSMRRYHDEPVSGRRNPPGQPRR